MLKKQAADDLFEKSSMSFGEHLEELRKTLIKSAIWLGIGTCIGLFFAKAIVRYIESPLKDAIQNFHVVHSEKEFAKANGVEPSDEFAAKLRELRVIPEVTYADPGVIAMLSRAGALITPIEPAAPPTDAPEAASPKASAASPVVIPPKADEGAKPAQAGAKPKEEEEKAAEPKEVSTPEVQEETKAEEAQAEQAKPEAEEKPKEEAKLEVTPEAKVDSVRVNPWVGVTEQKLNSLTPFLLWKPIPNNLVTLDATEGFMIWLKAGLVAGVIIGSPGIFWNIWQFFAAGLYPHERKYVYWYLPLSLALFLSGVSLAFYVIFELVLGFLMTYTAELDVDFMPRLNDYMSFALFLPLGFGIAFQLPLVMLGMHRFGLVSVETFISQWRIAVLAIAFLSMILTPAEVYSMVGLFLPLTGLYFFGIFLCKYMPTGAGVGAAAIDPQG
ncbi:twin-arginine translocase subunit TatC [Aureliella helgolandensis]|uniref:Sec-independent protein translocase protein TatC n=1 Tax=Aureliella helgolandensis TaxID=2527968 RepID=A0A518GEX9_9BACT|nr:twin-arginine translocase subunit TatC [Aureliella helgolandensis]QDV27156.1 Sec-independent protein translocase protein TatCy [Aureliella helgolandensis]